MKINYSPALLKIFFILFLFQSLGSNFLKAQISGPVFKWGKGIGGNLDDDLSSSEIDSHGNVYVSGIFKSPIDFDPSASSFILAPIPLFTNSFFAKYDSAGNFLWVKQLNGKYSLNPCILQLDSYDNIYLCGAYRDSTDFDPGPGVTVLVPKVANSSDIFFTKYDSNGNFIWAKSIYTNYIVESNNLMHIDKFNNIYISGMTADTADFDPGPGLSNVVSPNSPAHAGFIAKYDFNGNYKWAQFFDFYEGLIEEFISDNDQNLIVMGEYSIGMNYNIGSTNYHVPGFSHYTTMGGSNVWDGDNGFFTKLDSSGNYLWFDYFRSTENNLTYKLTVDAQNNILATGGSSQGKFIAANDSFALTHQGSDGAYYFVKFDKLGNILWAKNKDTNFSEIEQDSNGNIYLTGLLKNTVDFDMGPGYNVITPNSLAPFLAKYDSTLNLIWVKQLGQGRVYGRMILNKLPDIYFAGAYSGNISLDPDLLPANNINANGGYDICLAKYTLDTCSDFFVHIDSISDIYCPSVMGFASALATSGISPYSYSWNNFPVSNVSSMSTSIPGYYGVTANDSRGCFASTSIKINGPYQNDFDLDVNVAATIFLAGAYSTIALDVFNDGCVLQSGNLVVILDTGVTFNSSSPSPSLQNGDTLTWNFGSINFSSTHFKPIIDVTTTTIIPGTQLFFDVAVYPLIGDIDTTNNKKLCHFQVLNPWDPNQKSVYPEGNGLIGKITNNQTMTYTIHFQNTGNAAAHNVSIADTIDSDLDAQSIRVVGSSHSLSSTYLLPNNLVRFNFDNINLPDSGSNQYGSNGYVIYEIEQKQNLTHLTELENKAYIYFDFNPAIVTNTVLNTIDLPTKVSEGNKQEKEFSIYPNPVAKSMSIIFDKLDENSKVLIYDAQGKQIKLPFAISKNQIIVDTKDLQQGIYNAVITFPKTGESRSCKFIRM